MTLEERYEEYDKGTILFEKMSLEERDHLITPSAWNRRMPQPIFCHTHEQLMIGRSTEFMKKGYSFEAVRYGEGEREVYDIIRPNYVTDDTPVLVMFHGGYWMCSARDQLYGSTEEIVKAGGVCVCVGYDLTPKVSMSEIMEEAVRALEHLLTHALKHSRSIFLWAHCAGVVNTLWGCCHANLSQTALHAIKGFVLLSGVYDMKPVSLTSENKTLNLSREEVARLSFVERGSVDGLSSRFSHCSFLLGLSQYDSTEFFRQHNFFKEVLQARGLAVEEVVFSGWDHLESIEMMCLSDSLITKKILEFMGLSGSKKD